ncbi:simple sugar transport system permease protein [Aminobacter lissarensis]|uniref:Xylose transport system permease protein XylH n=1 Tax=Aminobacter carboxidus TaxID=376165 RepID=A0A8E1WHP7_9HYPH|nr:ABC transporter permease [Aminobacter lissarensis]MBB6469155.1 simple sugar transport system permease protein [Aminobacter lissarensis]
MSNDQTSKAATAPAKDERVKELNRFHKAIIRPELGAICGTIAVFVFFLVLAGGTSMFALDGVMNWSTVSAQFVVLAVGVCLLMIAGEFDLSLGSMVGFSGMLFALLVMQLGIPVWLAILVTLMACAALGAMNGWLVVRTGLPSFIVTLALLFILRGVTIWSAITFNRQPVVSGVGEVAAGDPVAWLFGGKAFTGLFQWFGEQGVIATFTRGTRMGQPVVDGIPMLILWAIALVLIGQWVLTRTRFGNWIFAAGGDPLAARYVGVPVARVKILMFMVAALCAALLGVSQVVEFGSAASDRGIMKEFEAIICVVIGGALLTGGYGSVVGAALGAIIFGVVQQGLFFTNVESSLFRVFLGTILLAAVLANTYIRRLITGEK